MKIITFLALTLAICASINLGQTREITEKQFAEIDEKGNEFLKAASYRLTRQTEYFLESAGAGRFAGSYIKEVIQPNKWRTVEEEQSGKRVERLWDGKALYERENDGPWKKYDAGASAGLKIESGRVTAKFVYSGRGDLNGIAVDIYEVNTVRDANKYSATGYLLVRFLRKTRYWFTPDGKLLKKVEENSIDGRNELSRETTLIEYDPNIKIEAPIK